MPLTHKLDSVPLFARLSEESRRRVTSGAVERTYPPGATLFRAGEMPAGIYIVLSGRVRVFRSRDGRHYVVHTEGPGGTLAEVPFFEGGQLPATAEAIEQSRCLILNRDALHAALRDDPAVAALFLRRLAIRIRQLVDRLDSATLLSVHARLAAYLLARSALSGELPFNLGMTQADLADELGTVREVVVRGLAHFRRTGAIRSAGRGRYVITDPNALHTMTGA